MLIMFSVQRDKHQMKPEIKCDISRTLRAAHKEDARSSSLEWSKNQKKATERPDRLTRGGAEQGDWLVLLKKKLAGATVPSAL